MQDKITIENQASATTMNEMVGSRQQVAQGVTMMTTVFVNLYFVSNERSGGWVLVDTGLPLQASRVRSTAAELFGADVPPACIILTHGHFDHAGNVLDLAREWGVPIYAHELEMPYLTGKSDYPPQDPTVGGALAEMSRLFPHSGIDLGDRVRALPADGSVPGLRGWRWLHTPGHTHGHVSLFRDADRLLLAGDAFATVNQESPITLLTLKRELRQPPAPFTTDWIASRRSIERLAELEPLTIAAGHGLPLTGTDAANNLRRFAINFTPPADGRYVREPAQADAGGITYLPPPVPDPVGKVIKGATLAVLAGAILATLARRKRRR